MERNKMFMLLCVPVLLMGLIGWGQRAAACERAKGERPFAAEKSSVRTGDTRPFTDVTEADWFYDEVQYVYENGLMIGDSDTTFGPNGTTTRAQVVTILYRLEGEPDLSGENLGYPYEDVPADIWYTDAVYWARLNGVVLGYSDTQFAPDDPITREQLAAMLYRYAQYKGYDVTATGDLSGFADGDTVSGWAEEAMSWSVGAGLIQGDENGLTPTATATRAQVAAILQRLAGWLISAHPEVEAEIGVAFYSGDILPPDASMEELQNALTTVMIAQWDILTGEMSFEPEPAFTFRDHGGRLLDCWDGAYRVMTYRDHEIIQQDPAYTLERVEWGADPRVLYGDEFQFTVEDGDGVLTPATGEVYRFADREGPSYVCGIDGGALRRRPVTLAGNQHDMTAGQYEDGVLRISYLPYNPVDLHASSLAYAVLDTRDLSVT